MSGESSGARRGRKKAAPEDPLRSTSVEVLRTLAADAALNEDQALTLLQRRDLPAAVLDELSHSRIARKNRRVLLALVAHPRTPRHVSLPAVRNLYTFELMQVALSPGIAPDLKIMAEEVLVGRVETLAEGERVTLARRAPARVAAVLLLDAEARVMQAALLNPYLTEAAIVKAVASEEASAALVEAVCRHSKWSRQRDVRVALLRKEATPLAHAITFAASIPAREVREVLAYSRLPQAVKTYLLGELERRKKRQPRS